MPTTGGIGSDEGLSEDQASNNLSEIEAQIAEDNRYGPFELVIEVAEDRSWIQVDVDGTTPISEIVDAPWKGTYAVTSTVRIQAGIPSNLKIYRNGIEVPMESRDGIGWLELKVEERPIVQNAQEADTASQL